SAVPNRGYKSPPPRPWPGSNTWQRPCSMSTGTRGSPASAPSASPGRRTPAGPARQARAAERRRRRRADPAAGGQFTVGVLETRRRGDGTVGMAPAAFLIADAVERGEHVLAELCRLGEDGFDEIGRGFGETRKVVVALDLEHVAQQE